MTVSSAVSARVGGSEIRMGEIVNLNRVRKDRAQAAAQATATTNRAVHGRSKAERVRAEAERARADRQLDGSKLED
jgi:predicted nucleic acid-binding protein